MRAFVGVVSIPIRLKRTFVLWPLYNVLEAFVVRGFVSAQR